MPAKKSKELKLGKPISFYKGEITLRFDEPSWTYYRVFDDGRMEAQAGVTSVCGIIDKSLYLIPWACKMMYLKLLRTTPRDAEGAVHMPWATFDLLLQEAKKSHKEKLDDAGNVGLAAHKWIEDTIRNAIALNGGVVDKMNILAPTDERSIKCGLAAFDWMQKHNVRWLSTERKICSRTYKYAGTADGLALVDNCDNPACCSKMFLDERSLIDWKTSNQLSVQYLYQTAAYQHAIMEETREMIEARWVLRLGKEEGEFESWYELNFAQDFAGYLACLNLWRAHKAVTLRMSEAKKLKTFKKREETAKQKIVFAVRKESA
jgi:hypothetical protein